MFSGGKTVDLVDGPGFGPCGMMFASIESMLSSPFSLESLVSVVEREIDFPITVEVLPPGLGPDISGLSVVVGDEIRIYHPSGPEWMRLVVVTRQLAHLLLHRPGGSAGAGVPRRTGDDPDGELLGILLADHAEQLLIGQDTTRTDDGQAVRAQLDLMMPLWAMLVDGTSAPLSWPEPLRLGGVRPGAGRGRGCPGRPRAAARPAAPENAAHPRTSEACLRWRRQRVVTDLYDMRRGLRGLVPPDLPALALEQVRGAGLFGPVATAAADRVFLEVALAARAGHAVTREPLGDDAGVWLPGRTPAEAAAHVAGQERLIAPGGVRTVIGAVRDLLTGAVADQVSGSPSQACHPPWRTSQAISP